MPLENYMFTSCVHSSPENHYICASPPAKTKSGLPPPGNFFAGAQCASVFLGMKSCYEFGIKLDLNGLNMESVYGRVRLPALWMGEFGSNVKKIGDNSFYYFQIWFTLQPRVVHKPAAVYSFPQHLSLFMWLKAYKTENPCLLFYRASLPWWKCEIRHVRKWRHYYARK